MQNRTRIGVLCPSEIALRRFMPALSKRDDFAYAGIGVAALSEWSGKDAMPEALLQAEQEKAKRFQEAYGGEIYAGYMALLDDPSVDAVYIPLPPALHFKWAKAALERGKHVLVEKPSTTCPEQTRELARLAEVRGLALHENYMFVFHKQIEYIQDCVRKGKLGEIRLFRLAFGFPFRGSTDFRYNRTLGGGALLDCGGYTVKLAQLLLGDTAKVVDARLDSARGMEVDIYGNAVLRNSAGVTAQLAFGMDNSYKCELEIWGSTGYLRADRVFTAPVGFCPKLLLCTAEGDQTVEIEEDDQFYRSLGYFAGQIRDENARLACRAGIVKQSELVHAIWERGR